MQSMLPATRASFKNILVLTDFSPASAQALTYSLAMAGHFRARLFLGRIREDAFSSSAEVGNTVGVSGILKDKKQCELAKLVEYDGIGFNTLVSRCDFQNAVPRWIAVYGIDLIVVGTCGRSGMQRSLLGSLAELAVQNALCPVLTVGPKVNVPRQFKLAFDRILFPAELGLHSGAGLPYALALAGERSARLTLLHVLPEDSCRYRDRTGILRFAMDELKKLLPDEASTFCKPEFAIDAGEAGEQIVRFARDEQQDVIVMGLPPVAESAAQMRSGVTYRVISSAVCPVLTVRNAVGTDSASRSQGVRV
ncbi:MAG: UspA [Candidatus Angelobacter sp.]|nr:UspA [Candidatus Angelobacter sp.]